MKPQPSLDSLILTIGIHFADMERGSELILMLRHTHNSPAPGLCDEGLERYLLGQIQEGAELTGIAEQLKCCPACAARAQAVADYICTMREALRMLEGGDPCQSRLTQGFQLILGATTTGFPD